MINTLAIKMDDIGRATQIDDIDVAIASLQKIAGITDGGIAGIIFADFDWTAADQWSRVERVAMWLRAERAMATKA